jgi:hypothetical protein
MADKSPFVSPLDQRSLAEEAKMRFASFNSDHLTLYNAFSGYVIVSL